MLNIGDRLCGFKCINIRPCREAGGNLVEMIHEETGAQLCWADNSENNKLFAVGFKTVPSDDTGVFHILEHSVLCGSEKYPVKEPFVELLKSSMNTFLNAMTFPDKTLYPVSSRNDHDFMNLMSVYLDAVFAPAILKNANIFYQEGHHIEQNDGVLSFNGVVFNEMKGAVAGADEVIGHEMMSMVYPDSCYGFNSGGDPEAIPNLTYEQFIDTYRRFYHPGNARFYLDGAIPLEETLGLIDTSIRGKGSRTDFREIKMQNPVSGEKEMLYEIAANEPKADRQRLEIAKTIGSWKDQTKIMAINVLADVLAGSNEAALTHHILEAGLAQDVEMGIEGGIAQPYVALSFKNVPDGRIDELKQKIRTFAEKTVCEGIDHDALKASLNCCEFRTREPKEPAALLRCLNAFNTWLYGGDPMDGISYEARFDELRRMIDDGEYERILSDILLDPKGMCIIVAKPAYNLSEEKDKRERERLEKIGENWSEEDKKNNQRLNDELRAWQQMPDSEDALATLPMLSISEVEAEPFYTDTTVSKHNGVTVLYHTAPQNGIINFALYFRLTDRTLEEMPMLSMIENLLGALGTEHYSAFELEEALKNNVGRMTFSMKVMAKREDNSKCTPLLGAYCSVLESNLEKAKELMEEILLRTDFSDETRIKEILLQMNESSREVAAAYGHTIARACTMAHHGSDLAATEAISGYTAAKWIRKAAENSSESVKEICRYISDLKDKLFTRARLLASVTAGNPIDLADLIDRFPQGEPVPAEAEYTTALPSRMGIRIPAQVGFSAQSSFTTEYSGALRVAVNILSLDYLWNVVRVRGGAYGTGLAAGRCGIVNSYSYRDPSPKNALQANRTASDYLREFCNSNQKIEKYIISAISNTEPLLSPAKRGILADDDYMEGYDLEYKRRVRKEMLDTNKERLLECADIIEAFADHGDICIVADDSILNTFEDIEVFDW